MKEENDELTQRIFDLNADLVAKAWKLDQDVRAFKDKNLLKRHNAELMTARQEHNLVKIDINIA